MALRVLILALAAASGSAQNLSVGAVVGANLTRGIESVTRPIAGATVEWGLPHNLSLEFDGVWHSYPVGRQLGTEVTWEFPVLAKYTFQLPFAKPFVEAGPSFRIGAPTASGLSAGAGVEFHVLRHLNIAPTLRYTHWDSNAVSNSYFGGWNPNQVEFLTAFSSTAEENSRPLGPYVSAGIVLGSTLTNQFRIVSETVLEGAGNSPTVNATGTSIGQSSFQIGPTVEFQLPLDLALEIEAIRRPIPELTVWTVPNGAVLSPSQSAALASLNAASPPSTVVLWDFPVLAKYQFLLSRAEPLVELGPSFRLPQELNGGHLSPYGITGGVGLEVHLRRLRIVPQLRFTHWASDSPVGSTRLNRSQLEFLTGFIL